MSIRFICGPSGSGKSTYIQKYIIHESIHDPGRKYLLIVPDQFTMQTQMHMIRLHPDHAFSNIEVLSFSRLSHRILEEVGGEIPVLDDTGKSLILRRISESVKPDLCVMGDRLDRIGFIHEVKSAISEFMQYGITPDRLHEIAGSGRDRRALGCKLADLETIYRAFMAYKEGDYITREETLELVRTSLHKSTLVKDAVIAFDGFTGFTPIQEKVIQELMVLSKQILFSFTAEDGADPHMSLPPENMFMLSHRSVERLGRLADEAHVPEEDPVILRRREAADGGGVDIKPDLLHLEKQLFRYPVSAYPEKPGSVRIYKAMSVSEEVTDTFQRIRDLISARGYRYRDIAIVVGDMSAYADEIALRARSLDMPVYMDYSRSILMSPFIEALLSAYDVIRTGYHHESVIRHMRTGFGPLTMSETDELENFLLRTGIRGRRAYEHTWTTGSASGDSDSEAAVILRTETTERLNRIREKVLAHFSGLHNATTKEDKDKAADPTISSYVESLRTFMTDADMSGRLARMAEEFRERGDHIRAMQYEQVYDKVSELLDQLVTLIGDDTCDPDDYVHILEAGLGEIRLGTIPGESDMIMVGDMIRTRLEDVRVLFLLGVNDDYIPGKVSTGGLISDIDREYLSTLDGVDLAPTPREQMYTQRLYLYMSMSKPSDALIVSYVTSDEKGNIRQPSYLISMLCKLFPRLTPQRSSVSHEVDRVTAPADKAHVAYVCADMMRRYAGGHLQDKEPGRLRQLLAVMEDHDSPALRRICDMSTIHYEHTPLSREIASVLYGEVIRTSVSRLERFAGCAYAHFLSFGLRLRERSEYSFESADLGEVYHRALEEFAGRVRDDGRGWDGISESDAEAWVDEIMDRVINTYGDTILISNNRNMAMSRRIRRIVKRSVDTIRYQVTQGGFVPEFFEKSFLETRHAQLSDGSSAEYKVTGKIDRIDICDTDDTKYLRIVDYKSGNRDFDLSALVHGLMLQLAVYMQEALHAYPDAKCAGMLYYHIADPVIEAPADVSETDADGCIRADLRMKGVVNSDPAVISLMDDKMGPGVSSDVIPVGYKKDSTLTAASKTYTEEELGCILDLAEAGMDELTAAILDGDISVHPSCMKKSRSLPCEWCDYASVCHISSGIPGYGVTRYDDIPDEQVFDELHR